MRDDLNGMLLTGERILWKGKPYDGLILSPSEVFLIPFSLLWGKFVVFWNINAWSISQNVLLFKLFGLPFLFAGLYITIGRFWVNILLRRRIQYGVTERRILIIKRGGNSKSVDIKRLPVMELSERDDGSGTIRFGAALSLLGGNNSGIWQPTFDSTPQFIRIPNVRSVYELIQKQTD